MEKRYGSSCRFERVDGENKYIHDKKEIAIEQYDLIMALEKTRLEAMVKDNKEEENNVPV